ncbi:MAG TPA: hypothetical protein ENK04_08975 [Gammaproteobacteria bacterium]|nr:hypothetical protein [Gammaproteobacteria bacterium]
MKAMKTTNIALAVAAASLFAFAPMATVQAGGDHDAKVHCYGVNKCKGNNDCKSAANACKGQSSCKGQGFVTMSKHACDAIGGKVGD